MDMWPVVPISRLGDVLWSSVDHPVKQYQKSFHSKDIANYIANRQQLAC